MEIKRRKDTYLSQVIELVKQAQESKSRTQDLANKAALICFRYREVTVMVIACPHALGLAIPLVVAVSTSLAAKSGLLIRQAFEKVKDVKAVVFDKTGTLTEDVTDIISFENSSENVLRFAASLESNSEHPTAKGIVESAVKRGIKLLPVENFTALPGRGVEGVAGRNLKIVSLGYLVENEIEVKSEGVERLKRAKR